MIDLETLRKYVNALKSGDPDLQLVQPDMDALIVQWAVDKIQQLQSQLQAKEQELAEANDRIKALEGELRDLLNDCTNGGKLTEIFMGIATKALLEDK